MSKTNDIQEVRKGILQDLEEIATHYESLKTVNPSQYCKRVVAEMHKYARRLAEHPTYLKYCHAMDLDQEEFIGSIISEATVLLDIGES